MATYQFSALSDGQAISFNPTADVLNFDQSAIAAADIRVTASGTSTRIEVVAGPNAGKDILLLSTTPFQLAASNVTFVDGSRVLFGDNSTATGDDNGNTLNGGTGRDLIFAFGGSDTINVGTANYGADHIDGGAGFDTLNFSGYVTAALTIDFAAGTITSSGGNATFANIERVIAGTGNDSIAGAAGAQNLTSGAGNDSLWGAGGVDTLWTGIGADVLLFREVGTANADNVGDFTSGTDKIALDASAMSALGASGNFAAGDARFWAAAGATGGHDADDRVVYNTTTRQVFYDADGSGSGAAQLIATLQSGATLVATDIVVQGGSSGQVINGTPGDDHLVGTSGNDTINGLGGNDTISGQGGRDSLNGGDGNDLLASRKEEGDSSHTLVGGAGDDTLDGWGYTHWPPTADTLDGGLGNDVFMVDSGDVVFDAGGLDEIVTKEIAWTLGAGFENLHVNNDVSENGSIGIGNELDNRISIGWGGGRVEGLAGNDTLSAGHNATLVLGGDGDDSLGANFVDDTLDGGSGNDTLVGGMTATGGSGADQFVIAADGSFEHDPVNSFEITDFVSGVDRLRFDATDFSALGVSGDFAPNDPRLYAAAGATQGHDGDDRIIFNTTTKEVFYDRDGSGNGVAELVARLQPGANLVATDISVDNGQPNGQVINGTSGNDSLIGTVGSDTINGLDGDDRLIGGSDEEDGNDSLFGGAGNDTITGGAGDDFFDGGSGNDLLVTLGKALGQSERYVGGDGNDTIIGGVFGTMDGGLGDDRYEIYPDNAGLPTLIDAGGTDSVVVVMMDFTLPDGFENLAVMHDSSESFRGGSVRLTGNALNNVIDARAAGNGSTLEGGAGNDTLFGSLEAPTPNQLFGGTGDDSLVGAGDGDFLDGGAGNDTLLGNGRGDTLSGGDGDDWLEGGSAQDAGLDALEGGLGRDTYVFRVRPAPDAQDKVTGFQTGIDKLAFDGAGFAEIGASGDFAAGDGRFWAAAGATSGHDGDDRIVYNTSTGDLYYDADGSGSVAARLVAHLEAGPSLSAGDIRVLGTATPGVHLVGTAGADSLAGGLGDDTLEGLGGNDTLTGHGGEDLLVGGDGNDVLEGGAADIHTLNGGAGNDTYHANAQSVLIDAGGIDDIFAENNWTLGSGFENLTIAGHGSTGFGNELANVMRATGPSMLRGAAGNDTIFGGAGGFNDLFGDDGDDVIQGSDGNDWITGGAGNDTLFGGTGNDRIYLSKFEADSGSDVIDGGAGADWLEYGDVQFGTGVNVDLSSGVATGGGVGGAGFASLTSIENVHGTGLADRILGDAGANFLYGDGGSDTLNGGAGNDTLSAGEEYRFTHYGAANADSIVEFRFGFAKIVLDSSVFTNIGSSGNFASNDARFFAGAGASSGHDTDDRVVYNTSTGDLWYDFDGSGAGIAQLIANLGVQWPLAATDIAVDNGTTGGSTGTAGNDSLTGTAGNDSLSGLAGNDTLRGLAGDDTLDGGDGVDSLDGGLGNDTYVVTAGDVIVSDPGGLDTVLTAVSWNISSGTVDNITMTGTANVSVEGNNLANVIVGNDAPNYINARGGSDTIAGNGGNDTFNMSKGGTTSFGNDSIDGGAGVDTVEFGVNATSGLVADLAAGTVTGGEANGAGSSTILNIERFIAGDFNDVVSGSAVANYVDARVGNDTVSGAAGNDTIIGGAGNDRLAGGTGVDSMTGGAGLDSFVFAEAGTANADRITDFVSASDKVALDDAGFTNIGPAGNFVAGDGRFWAAAGATSGHDANDRVIYNTSTGSLYYDADGSGAGAAQLIATFTGNPAIAATDITVI